MDEREGIVHSTLRVCFAFVELLARTIFRLIYGRRGQRMPPITDLVLLDSATTIARKIRTRKVTSVEVLNSFISRIKEINPLLNCVVEDRFEEALKEAHAADELIKSGTISQDDLEKHKPFLGVPFTTKDCIAVKGMVHTAGLYKRRDFRAEEDAVTISQLRNAGAIPIALTNIPELCMWWESTNTIYGTCNNPYDTNRIVGGSSGGEGSIQAAAGSAFGIGSDIGGSVRIPSFMNGIFGHKPSKRIVSIVGQYPQPFSEIQRDMLGIGPMCRRAEDLLPVLKTIVKEDVRDKLRLNEDVDLKKIAFYYQESNLGATWISPVNKEIKDLFKKINVHLKTAHNIKMEQVKIRGFRKSLNMWLVDMNPEGSPTFSEELANLEGRINTPLEMIKWVFRISNHTFIALLTVILQKFSLKPGSDKYNKTVTSREALQAEMEKLLGTNGVLIYPTHPTAAPYHNEPLIKPFNFCYTALVNCLGFPSTHCPMGLNSEGLPIGLQVISNIYNDRLCIAVAKELEKAFEGWVPPEILA